MDMSPGKMPQPPRPVAACPWCGPGSELAVQGDGLGFLALSCTRCGSAGPKASIAADFAEADNAAIALWSKRRLARPVERETLNRVGMAVRLHCLTGRLTPDATISVAWSDLDVLLRSVVPAEDAPAG